MKKLIGLIGCLLCACNLMAQQTKTEHVILITSDGLRWQEIFNGLDTNLLNNEQYTRGRRALIEKYGVHPDSSRMKLFPFLWQTLAKNGQIYGNRKYDNKVNVSNQQWFSYPGYNEILTGFADDERIHSNDKINNPNQTVLEFLHKMPAFKGKIAAFSTWDCFPYIINEGRSGIPVNSGKELVEGKLTPKESLLNEIQTLVPSMIADRHDFVSYFLAKEYLLQHKPKVMFLAFDETDDYAHAGLYDAYIQAAHNFDTFVADLWNTIQRMPQYKDKTALIIATDHGRGQYPKSKWTDHGIKTAYSDQIWLAMMGPDIPATGEQKQSQQLYQNQIAATLTHVLGIKYQNEKPVGEPIK